MSKLMEFNDEWKKQIQVLILYSPQLSILKTIFRLKEIFYISIRK